MGETDPASAEAPRARWGRWLSIAGPVALLAALAWQHPGLRFVDFLSFAQRAQRLTVGLDWINGLYPVGYPMLLLALKPVVGDVLWVGKALSVLAGGLAAWAAGRLARPGVVAALVASPVFLAWGSTEGTDLLAAALSLVALSLAERPAAAGAALGAACLVRYTAVAALPALLLLTPRRGRAMLALVVATAPHWAIGLWLRAPILPDQTSNFAIGGVSIGLGPQPSPWLEYARSLGRAARHALGHWLPALGATGLVVGAIRRQRPAISLLSWAAAHLAGVALAFSNPRLVLPATVAALLGWAWLVPARARPWLPLLTLAALPHLRELATPDAEERHLWEIVAVPAELPALSNSPLYHQREDGWLIGALLVPALQIPHRDLTPSRLRAEGLRRGFRTLALESGRVARNAPGLKPMTRGPAPPGYTLLADQGGWRLFSIDAEVGEGP